MIISNGGRGLPAYFRLEAAAFAAIEAIQFARLWKLREAVGSAGVAIGQVAFSPHTIAALASSRTWRVILTSRQRNSRIAAGV